MEGTAHCEEAFGAALASLEHMTPARLAALAEQTTLAEAWGRVSSGEASTQLTMLAPPAETPSLAASLAREAASIDPARVLQAHLDAGIEVVVKGRPGYPEILVDDPAAPLVLFLSGDREALRARRGRHRRHPGLHPRRARHRLRARRRAVPGRGGRGVRAGPGHRLRGARRRPRGRRGTPAGRGGKRPRRGVPAPQRRDVAQGGHRGPARQRAPARGASQGVALPGRNRIIAGLAEVVVVVESHATGGALQTAQQADERDITVMAVPGSIRSSASVGSNHLLTYPHTRCATGTADVLAELGLGPIGHLPTVDPRRRPSSFDQAVLASIDWQPTSIEQVLERSSLSLGELTLSLDRLEEDRWLVRRGAWVERVAAPPPDAPRSTGPVPVP